MMRTSRTGWALVAALMMAACSHAPVAPPAVEAAKAAPQPAFSAEGLAALEARMQAYVDDGAVQGIATRLVKDGEVVSEMKAGIRRAADEAPVEDDTIWRIYSMSKPVTGVALMTLWEEGAFQLDDPITKYFPEFEGMKVFKGLDAAGQPILETPARVATVRDLMSHTAGFGYGLRSGDYVNDQFQAKQVFQSPDLAELATRVSTIPLMYEPGTTWSYSISVDLQARLVELLTGERFSHALKARVLAPLGMGDTGFYVRDADYDRFSDVWGWSPEQFAFVPLPMPAFQFRKDTVAAELGGHGLVSTMRDYDRFAHMLANGGELDGVRILKPETVKMMATNVLPENVFVGHDGISGTDPAGGGFGLDFGVVTDGAATGNGFPDGAFMWGGAAGTWFWVDPVNDLYFIGMVQRFGQGGPPFDARETSARMVYEALTPAQ
jgi:CubicO group peptidase (beta-lactamase class C family)